jgi:ribosomal protein S18 acetylase RimI-like enzyme
MLAASTFEETFASDNDPRDMAAYAAHAFSERLQRAELLDSHTTVLLAERDGEPVGYGMLRGGKAPGCITEPDAIEIARLYALRKAIGTGVGAALMRACLGEVSVHGRRAVWLGVWERNARAIGFYERWGFHDVGWQHFQLGDDRQTDRLMMRRVTTEDRCGIP